MGRSANSLERLLEKYKIKPDLIERFGITDGPSFLIALHYLNACGYFSASILRCIAKDVFKCYGINKELLKKHLQFYVTECSPYLKSAFILFPAFIQRCPEAISTENDLLNAVHWINAGIKSGDTIGTVVHRCCNAVLNCAISLQLTKSIIVDCFFGEYLTRRQWCLSLKVVGSNSRKRILSEIRDLKEDGKLCSDDELMENLLTNEKDRQQDSNGADSEYSDSDFGEDELECYESIDEVDDLCKNISNQLDFSDSSGELSVLTMAEIIKRLSLYRQTRTENGVEIHRMPRNAIRCFYKSVKALVKEQSQYDDVEHFKRLLIIQLGTNSKKLIVFCQIHLEAYAKRLRLVDFSEVNNFFWQHFCKDPAIFKPYAVSMVLSVLIMYTKMDIVEVATRFCELSQEYKSKFMHNSFDIILNGVLEKNYGFDTDFHAVYNVLMKFSLYNWYKSWKAVYDGLFRDTPIPVPLALFKYRYVDLLDNGLAQLVFILSNKTSMLEFVQRLQFSLSLFERTYWMGPLGFDLDPWTKSKTADIANLLKKVEQRCPAYSFKSQIRNICARLEPVM